VRLTDQVSVVLKALIDEVSTDDLKRCLHRRLWQRFERIHKSILGPILSNCHNLVTEWWVHTSRMLRQISNPASSITHTQGASHAA